VESLSAEVVITGIREEMELVYVSATVDGSPTRFRFLRVLRAPGFPHEVWGGPAPRLLKQDPRFTESFRAGAGRTAIVDLITRWSNGDVVTLPARFVVRRK